MSLIDEIQAKCSLELIASRDYVAITAKVNEGRTRVVQPTFIGRGTVSDAIGSPMGPIFTRTLRLMAEANLPDGAPIEALAQKALIEEAWALLQEGRLDIGLESVRASIDSMVGVLPGLDAAGAERVKERAVVPDHVSVEQVQAAFDLQPISTWTGEVTSTEIRNGMVYATITYTSSVQGVPPRIETTFADDLTPSRVNSIIAARVLSLQNADAAFALFV